MEGELTIKTEARGDRETEWKLAGWGLSLD